MSLQAKTVAVIANGSIENYDYIATLIKKYDQVIAVDGGLHHCDRMGIMPQLIIGDMDSVTPDLLSRYSNVPTSVFPKDKDETDLELALKTLNFTPLDKVTLFGALGLRADHMLYNLHLMRRYPQKLYIETELDLIFAFNSPVTIDCSVGQTVSFIPLGGQGPVAGITSRGLKWELNDAVFTKDFMSISNICLQSPVQVNIQKGDLICCLQKG